MVYCVFLQHYSILQILRILHIYYSILWYITYILQHYRYITDITNNTYILRYIMVYYKKSAVYFSMALHISNIVFQKYILRDILFLQIIILIYFHIFISFVQYYEYFLLF